MKYSDTNKTSKNTIKISRDQYRPVSLEPVYSQFGARLSSPHNRIRSDAAHGAQPSQNVRINNIYIAKSISGSEDDTIATLSSTPCPIISIPEYNQGPENGPHDPTIGTGTCQCAAGLSQINAVLNRLPNFKDSNPQIDLNHLYHCFPIGSADNINGVPGDPRGAPFPDPNKSDAQICEYILRTISSGKCFPVKVQCDTSDVASKTQGPDCEVQTCIKWIKLKNVSKPPKAPTLADIKKQLCEGKPINVTLSGKILDDIIHDNNTGNYQPGVNQYIWPGSGGHGFGNHAHAIVIIGFTQTPTSIILHCQNSWGDILSRIDIVIPLDKLDEALQTSVSIGNSNDANDPTLWDFDVVDCDWFPSPIPAECCSPGCCCINNQTSSNYPSQESCEECETVYSCYEYMSLENPEDLCPEGWTSNGPGPCTRFTTPDSCSECSGSCSQSQIGPCGEWQTNADCEKEIMTPCEAPSVCLTTDQVSATLPASSYCQEKEFVFFMPNYTLTLQQNSSYQFSSFGLGGYATFNLSRQCSRWKLTGYGQGTVPSEPYSWSTVEIEADCGPAKEGECGPSEGLNCTGTASWSASACLINPSYMPTYTQQASGSNAYSASTTSGECP